MKNIYFNIIMILVSIIYVFLTSYVELYSNIQIEWLGSVIGFLGGVFILILGLIFILKGWKYPFSS